MSSGSCLPYRRYLRHLKAEEISLERYLHGNLKAGRFNIHAFDNMSSIHLKGIGDIVIGGNVGFISAGDLITKDFTIGGDLHSFAAGTDFSGTLTAAQVIGSFNLTDGGLHVFK